jgi:glutamine synthetase
MTQETYEKRRHAIMEKIYDLEETYSDGRPKFPRSLRAAMDELKKLNEEYQRGHDTTE